MDIQTNKNKILWKDADNNNKFRKKNEIKVELCC